MRPPSLAFFRALAAASRSTSLFMELSGSTVAMPTETVSRSDTPLEMCSMAASFSAERRRAAACLAPARSVKGSRRAKVSPSSLEKESSFLRHAAFLMISAVFLRHASPVLLP